MSSSNNTRAEQRRRIMRAAVGAPIMYTLSSGVALAQGSLLCAEKNSTPDELQTFTEDPDLMVRVTLQKFTVGAHGNASDVDRLVVFQYPDGTWYQVVDDTAASFTPMLENSPVEVSGDFLYALVEYSSETGVVFNPTERPENALTGSCGASLGVTVAGGFLDSGQI